MSEFFEMDPVTGIRTDTSFNDMTGEMTLIRTADVEPVLDYAKAVSNEVGVNREGIKQGWWHYCTIPPIVQVALYAKGIHISDPDHQQRLLQEINEHYPHLKTTTGHMSGKRKQLFI